MQKQKKLISIPEWWDEYWQDMPEFKQEDLSPYKTVRIHFQNQHDVDEFSNLLNQKITHKTKSLWYPKKDILKVDNLKYIEDES